MIIGITYYKNKATGLKCVDVVVPIIKSSADTSILVFTRPTDKYIKRRTDLKIIEEQLISGKEVWNRCLDLSDRNAFTIYKKLNYEIIIGTDVVDLEDNWIVNLIDTFKKSG